MNLFMEWSAQPGVQRLGWTLLHFVWQGAAVWAAVWAVLWVLRDARANARYLAACCGLALMGAAPAATFHWLGNAGSGALNFEAPPAAVQASDWPGPEQNSDLAAVPGPAFTSGPEGRRLLELVEGCLPILAGIWLLVVVLLLARLGIGWMRVRRLKRTSIEPAGEPWETVLGQLADRLGVNRGVKLFWSGLIESPALIGWLRPVILLPAGALTNLTPAQLEAILAHELAHVRRHDYLVNLLQNVIETFLFYHPAVWWVSRRISEERENCCDDVTVETCGNRVAYARALATLEEGRAGWPLALAAGGGALLKRIRRLTAGSGEQAGPGWSLAGPVAFVALAALLAVGGRWITAADKMPAAEAQQETSADGIGLEPVEERENGEQREGAPEGASAPSTEAGTRRAEDAREELILVTKPWTPPSSLRHPGVPPELPARQRIHGLLERIIVEEAGYDRIPLGEVIRDLADKSRQLDPEERGINFLVFSPESRAEGSTRDLNEARVRISPPLRQVRLVDVLEAVVKTAEVPLQYAVADYGIIFSEQKADRDLLITRSYKVGAGFLGHLKGMGEGARAEFDRQPSESARQFAASVGIDIPQFESGTEPAARKSIFLNEGAGILLVRAAREELEILERAIQALDVAPAQITIEVKVFEWADGMLSVPLEAALPNAPGGGVPDGIAPPGRFPDGFAAEGRPAERRAGPDLMLGGARPAPLTGILSEPQFRQLLGILRNGAKELASMKLTTLSGRQGILRQNGMEFDFIPSLTADGGSVHLTILIGNSAASPVEQGSDSGRVQVHTAVLVAHGHTLVLGGLTDARAADEPGGIAGGKRRLFFITPTVVDAHGNRLQSPETLPPGP